MNENILIIEDEEEFAGMVQLRLTLDGYRCDVEHHTLQGIRTLLSQRFDLLVLDLMVPGGGGLAVLEQREKNGLINLPVIVMTGQTITPDLKKRLNHYGVTAILNKPYDPIQFASIIHQCFNQTEKGAYYESIAS